MQTEIPSILMQSVAIAESTLKSHLGFGAISLETSLKFSLLISVIPISTNL